MPNTLENKVVIITGASRGIGRGIAKAFGRYGARLAVCARTEEALKSLQDEVEAEGGELFYQTADIFSEPSMKSFVEAVTAHYGRIDALLNNAMYMYGDGRPDVDNAEFNRMIEGGVISTNVMMNLVRPHMKAQGGGKIVNFTSHSGIDPQIGSYGYSSRAGYAASKAAIIALTKSAARFFAEDKINVNCIKPLGKTQSLVDMLRNVGHDPDSYPLNNRLGYFGDVEEDIAPICAFLCTDDSKYMSGEVVAADGGQ